MTFYSVPIYTSQMGLIQVSVSGVALDTGAWDTFAGGTVAVTNTTYHPGNFGPAVPLGGLRSIADITVTRAWSNTLISVYMALHNAAGYTGMTVSYTPALKSGPASSPLTYSGILLNVERPNVTNANADAQYMTLTMGVADSVTGS